MEEWSDQAIILSARPHGENGAVVSVMTENHGRHNGYVHAARSSRNRGSLEPGNLAHIEWKAKVEGQLGTMSIDNGKNLAAFIMGDHLKLSALLSACALCDASLPERENHPAVFYGMSALLDTLQSDVWGAVYVLWEIAFLKELGFGLDFTRCVANGDASTLAYISPKSGCAVSRAAAEPYKDKLLPLPEFLKPGGIRDGEAPEVLKGLKMTAHFLQNWVFAHHSKGVPEARLRFESLFAKTVEDQIISAA